MREPNEKIYVDMPIPDEVRSIHQAIVGAGGKLYVVGGSVRDFWRSIETGKSFTPKDYDLVTDLHPDRVIAALKGLEGVYIREVGKSFGVVLVTIKGIDYEIATFREDAKTGDGRRPDYVTFSTIDKDAERRDLTINALYYDIENSCILDFFTGILDIRANLVRFVGDVLARIYEDKLRIMRFVRFHCRMTNKTDVDKDTKEVIKRTSLRPEISEERIADEFIKGISSAIDVKQYIHIMNDLGLLQQVFKGLKVNPYVDRSENLESTIADILIHNEPGAVKDRLLALKWTSQEATDISFLLRLSSFKKEEQFVDFKKAQQRCTLKEDVIKAYIDKLDSPLLVDMLYAPYPTVRGEEVIEETGLTGKSLGDEMVKREIKNFTVWKDF